MRRCTLAFCLKSCLIKVKETCLHKYIIKFCSLFYSLTKYMKLKLYFHYYLKGYPKRYFFLNLYGNLYIYWDYSPASCHITNWYYKTWCTRAVLQTPLSFINSICAVHMWCQPKRGLADPLSPPYQQKSEKRVRNSSKLFL